MKVMIYADTIYPASIGGGEKYVHDLATSLNNLGIDVLVVTPYMNLKNAPAMIKNGNYNVYPLTKNIKLGKIKINISDIVHSINHFKPDVIHVSGPSINEIPILVYAHFKKIPCILTYHTDFYSKIGILVNYFFGVLFENNFGKIIVQTNREKNKLIKRGIKPQKITILYFNGIDKGKFKCSNNHEKKNNRILFVGSLDQNHLYKGLELLLYAIDTYHKKFADKPELTVVGEGDLKKFYEKMSSNLKINAAFIGNVSEEELLELYCSSGIFILPSKSEAEGFGRVALEAISCGLPVIVSKYAGISELVSRYNAGLVVDPYNAEEFSGAIRLLLNDNKLGERIISNGYKLINEETLTLDETINKTVNLYNKILSKNHRIQK